MNRARAIVFFLGAFFLFEKGLFAQKEAARSPFLAWFEVEGADSLFSLRANFSSERPFPLPFFWRIQIIDGEKKERRSGESIAFPTEPTFVFEEIFSLRKPVETRTVELYVLDGDQIIARKRLALEDIGSFFEEKDEPAAAQKPQQIPEKKPLVARDDFGLELGGFVINEMRTRPGRDFFQKFMAVWSPPAKSEGWWIALRELPAQGRSTVLSVSLNNKELFQRFLPLQVDAQAELAAAVANYLAQLVGQGFDGTLTDDDLKGVGIE